MRKKRLPLNLATQNKVIIFTSIKVMSKFIKECLIGTAIITVVVMFLATAVIALYAAAGK